MDCTLQDKIGRGRITINFYLVSAVCKTFFSVFCMSLRLGTVNPHSADEEIGLEQGEVLFRMCEGGNVE